MPAVDMSVDIPPKQQAKRKLKAFAKLTGVNCVIKRQYDTRPKQIVGDDLVSATTSVVSVHVESRSTTRLEHFLLAAYHAFSKYVLLDIDNVRNQMLNRPSITIPTNFPSGHTDISDDATSIEDIPTPENYKHIPIKFKFDPKWALLETYLTKLKAVPSSSESANTSSAYESNTEILDRHTNKPRVGKVASTPKQVKIKHTNVTTLTLQRATGTFQIDSLMYDKKDCSGWTVDNIKKLLGCLRSNGGVGLDEEDVSSVKLKGSTLENVIDALINFNGDIEAKIEHACKEIECQKSISNSIVRWFFANLLEYK